jgi:thiamine biosynthesis lipoprotein
MPRETRLIMGMPVTIEIAGTPPAGLMDEVFGYFETVDRRFSLWKPESEICALNRGEIDEAEISADMAEVLAVAERTKRETRGYFDILRADGSRDPSGIVKGWAIRRAAELIARAGCRDYFVDAGGDIQSAGCNEAGKPWTVGIRNPFNSHQIIKAVTPNGRGIATSGNYVRGDHIYNPHRPAETIAGLVSLTVIGPDVLEADRFATGAFAMGIEGIQFIESRPDLEGYAVDGNGIATMTTGFGAFVIQ